MVNYAILNTFIMSNGKVYSQNWISKLNMVHHSHFLWIKHEDFLGYNNGPCKLEKLILKIESLGCRWCIIDILYE